MGEIFLKKERLIMSIIIVALAVLSLVLAIKLTRKTESAIKVNTNEYDMAFYELVDYVQNVETYLAKSLVSTTAEHGAETLTHVWREADLAQSYLAMLPLESQEFENTEKFLNQVSEYSYSLSRKNIYNEELTDEDLANLQKMYDYSVELSNTLNQLSSELSNGEISWEELNDSDSTSDAVATQVSASISKDSFANLEQNFHEYSGLIYDGAFSEHIVTAEKKGVTGENIDEETAKQKVIEFVGEEKIKSIESLGISENASTPVYTFSIKTDIEDNITITITQKGGHIVYMNCDRKVEIEDISQDAANEIGKNFLEEKGFTNMQATYYLKQSGIVTINYGYVQDDVLMYADLIKVKIALDNGEILGIETTGYLNCHYERDLNVEKISIDEAKKNLNNDLQISSEKLVMIPTEYKTEILCYEFKGKLNDINFIIYINAETGIEEDVLIVTTTENGTLTM
jgi:germination protein YpeB